MARQWTDPDRYVECLAAMAVSGDVFLCESLAPVPQAGRAAPPGPTATTLQTSHGPTVTKTTYEG